MPATREKLVKLFSSVLSVYDAAVLEIDGIVFHECCSVGALVITADRTMFPVGVVLEGDIGEHDGPKAPPGRSH